MNYPLPKGSGFSLHFIKIDKGEIQMYLEKINQPADVKKLSMEELKETAKEMRAALIQKLSRHG